MTRQDPQPEQLAYSVARFAQASDCSKSYIYKILREKKLYYVRASARKILIPRWAVDAFLQRRADD